MSQYQNEIRASDIAALAEKVQRASYGKYLKRVTLKRVRGFHNREVSFDFPVTAIVGPNGGGKTTVLGAAALVYKDIPPSQFFAKSGKYDASMQDWAIEYDLIDKDLQHRISVSRTASFRTAKWNRKAVDREVLVFGVSRTVPASERRELVKAAANKFAAHAEVELDPSVIKAVGSILGKDIAGYNRLSVNPDGKVTMFAARVPAGDVYSEFHFGAGEASVIRMVSAIETASDNTLILIEEIENGLHPVATRRMVEYLLSVAQRKSCQVIFTTHSQDALDPLPSKGIWAAYNGEVLQGKPRIEALRMIAGQVPAQLAVFVEDDFATNLVRAAMREHGGMDMQGLEIHGLGGADPAVKVHLQHNIDPTRSCDSICLVDGDRQDLVDHTKKIFALPGDTSPETHIFRAVVERLDVVAPRLALAMQLRSADQERVKAVVREKDLTNQDRHLIFQQIGDELDFTAEMIVSNAFLAIWAQEYAEEVASIVNALGGTVTPPPGATAGTP